MAREPVAHQYDPSNVARLVRIVMTGELMMVRCDGNSETVVPGGGS